ncbi:MAG: iron-containing alcohol dehydrogenase [Hyphomicrobiales bacterium]|jgi:4-hydroxybutyrate dehydrogenase|nr:iron-containing alcohol dehydrogenase [Hyphomicrobiales bacterium]
MALINYLTRIHFADLVLEDALAEQLRLLGVRRPLIVTDRVGGHEALARVTDALPSTIEVRIRLVSGASASDRLVDDIAAAFAAGACDGFIGLGGKVALSLTRRAVHERRTSAAPAADGTAMIAIPTTTACVGLQPLFGCKVCGGRRTGTVAAAMLPDVVLCDPTLTLDQDEAATAAAGMDALTHCIEAYLGTTWNPPADGIALDGVRRARSSLGNAVRDGANLDARREMLAAALDAGLASQKGLGSVEALAEAVEDEINADVAHGSLHAALLPPVLAFNAPAIGARLGTLREALQIASDDAMPEAIAALGAGIRLPVTLAPFGLDRAARGRIARRAAEHPATRTNPRHVTAADYLRILEHAC